MSRCGCCSLEMTSIMTKSVTEGPPTLTSSDFTRAASDDSNSQFGESSAAVPLTLPLVPLAAGLALVALALVPFALMPLASVPLGVSLGSAAAMSCGGTMSAYWPKHALHWLATCSSAVTTTCTVGAHSLLQACPAAGNNVNVFPLFMLVLHLQGGQLVNAIRMQMHKAAQQAKGCMYTCMQTTNT